MRTYVLHLADRLNRNGESCKISLKWSPDFRPDQLWFVADSGSTRASYPVRRSRFLNVASQPGVTPQVIGSPHVKVGSLDGKAVVLQVSIRDFDDLFLVVEQDVRPLLERVNA